MIQVVSNTGLTVYSLHYIRCSQKYRSTYNIELQVDLFIQLFTRCQIGKIYRHQNGCGLTLSSIYTDFNSLKKKKFRKTLWKKVKLLILSNFTFFHNVFYTVFLLKSFPSHISVFVCSFFEFGKISKWCIGEWVEHREFVYCRTHCRKY